MIWPVYSTWPESYLPALLTWIWKCGPVRSISCMLLKQPLASSLCWMNAHGLSRVEVSPFHPNALLRVRGELLQELVCDPVVVEVRIGDSRGNSCYADSLPAWYKNSPVLVQAGTHLISTEAEIAKVSCEATYTPVFQSREGVLLHLMSKCWTSR